MVYSQEVGNLHVSFVRGIGFWRNGQCNCQTLVKQTATACELKIGQNLTILVVSDQLDSGHYKYAEFRVSAWFAFSLISSRPSPTKSAAV